MKQDKHKMEKDVVEVSPPATEPAGIDFLVILQAGAGILCLLLVAWVVLKFVLHIF